MAAGAGKSLTRRGHGFDVMHDVVMTFAAGVFRDPPAAFLDLDRIVKFAGGEGERVKETVLGLGEILGNEPGRGVAIVAGCDRVMAGIVPAIEMILHNVAIGAGIGIVPEVRSSLGINECVTSQTGRSPESDGDHGREHDRHPGLGPY